jgi:tetratricopeptide (TPR) repeat protein
MTARAVWALAAFLLAAVFSIGQSADPALRQRLDAGRAYYDAGKLGEAISEFRAAVKQAPNDSWAHLWLARALGRRAGKASALRAGFLVGEVRREFERAVELDPHNLEARSDLLDFYLQAPALFGGGVDKARVQAEAMAKLDKGEGHSAYARIAEKAKKLEEAEREYRAAIEADPNRPGYRRDLEMFWKRHGIQRKEAERLPLQ